MCVPFGGVCNVHMLYVASHSITTPQREIFAYTFEHFHKGITNHHDVVFFSHPHKARIQTVSVSVNVSAREREKGIE